MTLLPLSHARNEWNPICNRIPLKKHTTLSKTLEIRNGENNNDIHISIKPTKAIKVKPLTVLRVTAFLLAFSNSVIMFSPVQELIPKIGSEQTTSVLSALSSIAAFVQIAFSPVLGSILDSFGRKPTMIYAVLFSAGANSMVSLHPSLVSICAARLITSICSGFLALCTQAMLSDLLSSNPAEMGSVFGIQMAVGTAGFLFGTIGAGQWSSFGISTIYGISAFFGLLSYIIMQSWLIESLPISQRVPFQKGAIQRLLWEAPIASIRLLHRHGSDVRMLAIILMLQSMPMHMGEFFQVFSRTEWDLSTRNLSSFVAMFGIVGLISNILGSLLLPKIGIPQFTSLAIISSLFSPVGSLLFGFRGMAGGAILGFLGSSQTLGIIAALVSKGVKSGIPQGELAGERSSLIALMKVFGPIWYSMVSKLLHDILTILYVNFSNIYVYICILS